ncbi:hypothetical protein K9S39_06585 [Streptomyces halobius]|uniref:DDE superfamily endonuclease n=1 Tax=Streptomyces halobius TaxID=2879846 RepID=A0ABY4M2Z3_9ACTN|nr:hypothetical protein [Streptomyces halobius]UQA91573.1 hypothetical protein K9S39_06585 [Streptomyces halobius]
MLQRPLEPELYPQRELLSYGPSRSNDQGVHDQGVGPGDWAAANNVEFAYTPTNSSWLNRIEAQFTALRYFTLDGTDHASHKEQGSMIRRYII